MVFRHVRELERTGDVAAHVNMFIGRAQRRVGDDAALGDLHASGVQSQAFDIHLAPHRDQ